MKYNWKDYNAVYSEIINSWLDSEAISMTELDEDFDSYVNAVTEDSANFPNTEFKVIFQGDSPIAVAVYGIYNEVVTVMEIVVAPNERGKGKGSEIIRELLQICNESFDETVKQFRVVIFPNNIASQKAFEKAGFRFESAHEDGDAWYYVFDEEKDR